MKKELFFIIITFLFVACSESDDELVGNIDNSSYFGFNNSKVSADLSGSINGENYGEYVENSFIETSKEPTSTFSIDADGGSYCNVRRFLNAGSLPPKYAIRTEEFINYFNYEYPNASDGDAISLNGEMCACPWKKGNKLIRIGIKGKEISKNEFPYANFVLLVDVSGSMASEDKLGLLKASFNTFVDQMRDEDRIAIVTYAGSAGIVLKSTNGTKKQEIKNAINKLDAKGSTAGAKGIITAYEIAEQNFIKGGNNRIIIGSDGDFNVGPTSVEELKKLVETKRDKGIYLTTLGVGTNNFNEAMMEQIANNGNGTYEYIDNLKQAEKVFIYEYNKFLTVAKDVKIQIEFNPKVIKSYRLIGYENRLLENKDFEDDTKDAGEIGAGQCITAIYEVEPTKNHKKATYAFGIDFRYKKTDEEQSQPLQLNINNSAKPFNEASENMRFAACTAGFGMLLFESEYSGSLTYDNIIDWAGSSKSYDPYKFRDEFVNLVRKAKSL